MHVRDLFVELQAMGLYLDKSYESFRDTFTGTIGHKARRNQVFTSEGNGFYGLREWITTAKPAVEPEAARVNWNTDLVAQYVASHDGQTRKEVIEAAQNIIKTNGEPRKVASTIVGALITKERLVEVEGRLYVKGAPQLTLMKDHTAA
jgi:hypothetical protein